MADLLEGRTPASLQGELGRSLAPSPPPLWAKVDLGGVRVERVRDFGQVVFAFSAVKGKVCSEFRGRASFWRETSIA